MRGARQLARPLSRRPLSTQAVGTEAVATTAQRLPPHQRPALSTEENLWLRRRHLAPALKAHYAGTPSGPLHLVSGQRQYLYEHDGSQNLDLVNNVCHVGHCHPRIVEAASRQLGRLNTNSRYLHDNIVRLSQELTSTLPRQLTTCFFVNSGSEANDLALRLARNHTERKDVYCVDGAYHGNSTATLAISPYSRYAPIEKPDGVERLMQPDAYRLGLPGREVTARALDEYATKLRGGGSPPAAYIVESIQSCGGQVFLPDGYLQGMTELTRAYGGLTIADEVQTGFGRVGHSYWAFERHGVCPDILTVGKPFGNGFPLAAVVTTSAVAETFSQCEYFNTFGGNPVATAVGLEVLSVVADERLQQNAAAVGGHAMRLLTPLAARHDFVGDVRGEGLMIGVELVKDKTTREPHPELAKHLMAHMRANRVLVSVDGPHASVIKMKPPVCVTEADMDNMADALDNALCDAPQLAVSSRAPHRAAAGGSQAIPPLSAMQSHSSSHSSGSRALPSLSALLERVSEAVSSSPSSRAAPASPQSSSSSSSATSALSSMLQRMQRK